MKAQALVVRDLRQMQKEPVSSEELERAKALLIRQIPLSEGSLDGIASQFLTLSGLDLPLDEPLRAAKRYLELTAGQVQASMAKWIRPDAFVQITLGPKPE